eukprot:366024-Chlamydomonas_euryale.AAC.21
MEGLFATPPACRRIRGCAATPPHFHAFQLLAAINGMRMSVHHAPAPVGEQSGYTAFYHHLLEPHVHYMPVWQQTPDDVLEAIRWGERGVEPGWHPCTAERVHEAVILAALRFVWTWFVWMWCIRKGAIQADIRRAVSANAAACCACGKD